jgi:hypothetical protein
MDPPFASSVSGLNQSLFLQEKHYWFPAVFAKHEAREHALIAGADVIISWYFLMTDVALCNGHCFLIL